MAKKGIIKLEVRSQIQYLLNNDLSTFAVNGGRGRFCPWVQKLQEWDVEVLVLNWGAHYVLYHKFESELQHTLHILKEFFPHTFVKYRYNPASLKHTNPYLVR